MPTEEQLVAELMALRKGPGLCRPAVTDRVGAGLREVCGLGHAATSTDVRSALTATLDAAADALPAEVGRAARVMLALEPGYPDLSLTGRQSRLAAVLGVDPVTVRRRCDLALRLLAERLVSEGPMMSPADPFGRHKWYTVSNASTLRLDTASPEVVSTLTVAALLDGLDGVELRLGIPRPRSESRPRMDVDLGVQFGGLLESRRQLSAEYFAYHVRFPRPLRRGETHTFATVARIPDGQHMAPHHVFWTRRRVDRFDLRRPPHAVWRIDGVPHWLSEADGPTRELLVPDGVGEVAVAFERLVLGLGYEVAWLPRLPGSAQEQDGL